MQKAIVLQGPKGYWYVQMWGKKYFVNGEEETIQIAGTIYELVMPSTNLPVEEVAQAMPRTRRRRNKGDKKAGKKTLAPKA